MQINDLTLFDHLSPRLQELLYEAKTFKNEIYFKFCGAKGGFCFSTQDGLLQDHQIRPSSALENDG